MTDFPRRSTESQGQQKRKSGCRSALGEGEGGGPAHGGGRLKVRVVVLHMEAGLLHYSCLRGQLGRFETTLTSSPTPEILVNYLSEWSSTLSSLYKFPKQIPRCNEMMEDVGLQFPN